MSQAILITTTSDDKSVLKKISEILVSKKLAACCQISGPIESVYVWKGQVESVNEWVCSIKTVRDVTSRVDAEIKQLHNYELPEIIHIDIHGGSSEYLEWIADQVQPG